MRRSPLVIRRASIHEIGTVQRLIEAAAQWLGSKNTDQWASPWPSEQARTQRILTGLRSGRTWIAWDRQRPAATITADPNDYQAWPADLQGDPAVYVSRLVVSRPYAGRGLGAQLVDWAGLRARREHGADWVRVDVWTTNTALHGYYEQLGFELCGWCASIPGYPSAALFQKPTGEIAHLDAPLFQEVPPPGED
jgi:GNAT superfamily N-acetyltransferase